MAITGLEFFQVGYTWGGMELINPFPIFLIVMLSFAITRNTKRVTQLLLPMGAAFWSMGMTPGYIFLVASGFAWLVQTFSMTSLGSLLEVSSEARTVAMTQASSVARAGGKAALASGRLVGGLAGDAMGNPLTRYKLRKQARLSAYGGRMQDQYGQQEADKQTLWEEERKQQRTGLLGRKTRDAKLYGEAAGIRTIREANKIKAARHTAKRERQHKINEDNEFFEQDMKLTGKQMLAKAGYKIDADTRYMGTRNQLEIDSTFDKEKRYGVKTLLEREGPLDALGNLGTVWTEAKKDANKALKNKNLEGYKLATKRQESILASIQGLVGRTTLSPEMSNILNKQAFGTGKVYEDLEAVREMFK